jgi:hypothetical protein
MGIFDDLTGALDSAISGIFGGTGATGSQYVGGSDQPGTPVYQYPVAQPQYQQYAQPVMAMAPMLAGASGVARWAMSFPSLWQALQLIRANYRIPMTVDKLWSLVKSAGPVVVSGLIGAAALQELFVYHSTHKRRRMNVANTKALRRSVRRLKGFDRLSHRVSSQLARVGGRRHRSASRRCGTCRHSPCTC